MHGRRLQTSMQVLTTIGGLIALAAAPAVRAQETLEKVEVHGVGGWGYGRTDGNQYLFGRKKGEYRNTYFDANLGATLGPRLRVDAQVGWNHDGDETTTEADFAFAEWKFSDALRLRVGQVKQPFGIYAEVFDVGTVRPFLVLPQSVYGPVGAVGISYNGMGLTGSRIFASGWRMQYDAYVGGLDLEETEAGLEFVRHGPPPAGQQLPAERIESSRDLLGARIAFETPIDGLSVGASGYTATMILPGDPRLTVGGVHAEYLTESWSARTEYVHVAETELQRLHAAYGEVAYRFTTQWQGALKYEHSDTALPGIDPSRAPSLLRHREAGVGLNYWFAPNMVFKLSYHRVDGNRLAAPAAADLPGVVQAGALARGTHLVLFGTDFSF